jgi:hypothetical protein
MLQLQDGKLLPKHQVFQEQVVARAKEANRQNREKPKQAQHGVGFTRNQVKSGAPAKYLI